MAIICINDIELFMHVQKSLVLPPLDAELDLSYAASLSRLGTAEAMLFPSDSSVTFILQKSLLCTQALFYVNSKGKVTYELFIQLSHMSVFNRHVSGGPYSAVWHLERTSNSQFTAQLLPC